MITPSTLALPPLGIGIWHTIYISISHHFFSQCLCGIHYYTKHGEMGRPLSQSHSPGNDEARGPQEAVAEITNSQVDGHELVMPQPLRLASQNKQHQAITGYGHNA